MRWLSSLALILALCLPRTADACSCVLVTADDAFAQHAAVFEGRVVEVRRPDDPSGALIAVLDVVQQWKGISAERVEVSTPSQSSLCGIEFEPGTSWLVYADGQEGGWSTDLCARTRLMSEADEDLAAFGAGVVPVEITEEDEVEPQPTREAPPARGGCASCAAAPTNTRLGWLSLIGLGLALARLRRTGS